MTWEIFLGISAIVAFAIAIITPIIKLNTNITKLSCTIESMVAVNARADKRLDAHADKLDDHEHRITVLEGCEHRITMFDSSEANHK